MSKTEKTKKNRSKKEGEKIGNTKSKRRQSSQLYQWFFTLNNWEPIDILHLKMRFNSMCK